MMTKGHTGVRILKNSLFLVGSRLFERIIAFVLPLYIARSLGRVSLGEYSLVTSLLTIFATFAYFGQNILLPREVAKHREEAAKYLVNASLICLVAAALFSGAMALLGQIMGYDPGILAALLVAALALFPDTLSTVAEAVLVGLERMDYIGVVRVIVNVIRVVISVAMLKMGYGLWSIFAAYGLAQVVLLLAYWRFVARYQPMGANNLDRAMSKEIVGTSSIFLGISLFGVTFRNIDVILLERIRSLDEVGVYSAPDKLMSMISVTAPGFFRSIFPVLAKAFATSQEKFASFSVAAIKFVVVVIIAAALVVTALADRIVLLVYDREFASSIIVLQLLAWQQVPSLVASVMAWVMISGNLERASLRISAVKAGVNLLLNLALIPPLGAVGAAIAAIATQVAAVIMRLMDIRQRLFRFDPLPVFGKPALSAALAASLFLALRAINIYLALAAMLLLYGLSLFLWGVVSQDEWGLLRGMWRNLSARSMAVIRGS